jgi:hypothetical protein
MVFVFVCAHPWFHPESERVCEISSFLDLT